MDKKISQEEFLKLVKEDKLDKLTFVMDLSSTSAKKIKMLSKIRDKVLDYDLSSAHSKLEELYREYTGENLNKRPEDIKNYISIIDQFSKNYFEPFGLKKHADSIKTYNYFIETDLKQEAAKRAKQLGKGPYHKVMDWTKYPAFATLYCNVLNPSAEHNKLYKTNGENVEVLEYFCSLLNFIFTSKQNSSVAPVIISKMHGTGKGTLTKSLQRVLGKYSTRIDNDAFNSEFNGIFQNKALTIYDEAKTSDKINNMLKGLIGNSTFNARSMYSDRVEEQNGNNFILTGNLSKDLVVYIEPEDRRYVPLYSRDMKLTDAIYRELSMSYDQFEKQLMKEEVDFYADILRIDTPFHISGHTVVTNKVKKEMIQSLFGKSGDLMQAINKGDLNIIEDNLFDHINTPAYRKFIDEVKAGYLTKQSIVFLSSSIEDEAFLRDLKKQGLKYWDDAFGKSQKITTNGTSFMARKLPTFDKSKVNVKKKKEASFDDEFSLFDE